MITGMKYTIKEGPVCLECNYKPTPSELEASDRCPTCGKEYSVSLPSDFKDEKDKGPVLKIVEPRFRARIERGIAGI